MLTIQRIPPMINTNSWSSNIILQLPKNWLVMLMADRAG